MQKRIIGSGLFSLKRGGYVQFLRCIKLCTPTPLILVGGMGVSATMVGTPGWGGIMSLGKVIFSLAFAVTLCLLVSNSTMGGEPDLTGVAQEIEVKGKQ